MDISNRLQKVLEHSKLSVRGLALKCGLKQQTFDKHIKGIAEPSATTLKAIVIHFPEISAEWLITGEGEMLRSESKETERINAMLDTITILQETIRTKDDTIKMLMKRIYELENH